MTQRERERAHRSLLGGFIALVTYGGFFLYGSLTESADLDVHTRRALQMAVALGTIVVLLAGSFFILGLALRNCRGADAVSEQAAASHSSSAASEKAPVRAKRVCQAMGILAWLLGGILLVEACLGRAVLPWEEPDPTTGTASLFVLFLGLLVWFAGDFAALRQRVERLEQRLRDAGAPDAEPGAAPDRGGR
jgi:hypothetical protein